MALVDAIARNVLDFVSLGPGFPFRHLSHLLRRRTHTATIRLAGRITVRTKSSDAATFVDIFRRRAYDLSGLQQHGRVFARYRAILAEGRTPVVVDAGANVGAASIWFSRAFPQAVIRAVEPDPDNARMLRLNTAAHPRIEVIEAAIGAERGRVTLSNPDQQAWAIRSRRDDDGAVAVTTIPALLETGGATETLFLVKVDIEGFEADLFSGNLGWLDEAEVVIIEPHDWLLPGAGSSHNFQKAMLERDFELVISGENLIYLRVGRGG